MIIKKHSIRNQVLLAICDDSLLGKKFEEHGLQLDLTSSFYRGEPCDTARAKALISQASMLNIVGKESVSFCVKLGLVDPKRVIKVKGIPHAQILMGK